jgi:hypothetical protein
LPLLAGTAIHKRVLKGRVWGRAAHTRFRQRTLTGCGGAIFAGAQPAWINVDFRSGIGIKLGFTTTPNCSRLPITRQVDPEGQPTGKLLRNTVEQTGNQNRAVAIQCLKENSFADLSRAASFLA